MSKTDAVRLLEDMIGENDFTFEADVLMEEIGSSAHEMLFQAWALVQAAMRHDDFLGGAEGEDSDVFLAMANGNAAYALALTALNALSSASVKSSPKDSYLSRIGYRSMKGTI